MDMVSNVNPARCNSVTVSPSCLSPLNLPITMSKVGEGSNSGMAEMAHQLPLTAEPSIPVAISCSPNFFACAPVPMMADAPSPSATLRALAIASDT
jgi:hypothetical protein